MDELQFAILGLGVGTAYVLIGQGIVLVYRGSGLLNFAQGAIAMLTAEVFYRTRDLPTVVGLALAIALAAAIGLAMDVVILRRLRHASALVRLIATLGLLTLLMGLGTAWWGDYTEPVTDGLLPTESLRLGDSLSVGADRVILFGGALVLTFVLGLVFQRTRYGLATSAVAENQQFLTALGWAPARISAANWALGSGLAGIAGILVAPISGLSVTTLTLMVIPGLAAALIGGFSSFWWTAAGGLALGVAQSELTLHVSTPGWTVAAPFLVIVALVVIQGRALPLRGELVEHPMRVGRGRVPGYWPAILALAGGLLIGFLSDDWLIAASSTILLGIVASSLILVTGYAGQISLAQLTIAGVGALAAGRLGDAGVPFVPSVVLGAAAAAGVGVVFALPALRCRGANLAVVTIGLSLALERLVLQNSTLNGGAAGFTVPGPSILGVELDFLGHPVRFTLMAFVVFVGCALIVTNIRRGATGRRLLAVRSNERAAAAAGVDVLGAKLYAFVVGAGLAGLGGALAAYEFPRVNLDEYTTLGSITLIVNVVVGGIGYVFGAINGGISSSGGVFAQALSYLGGGWIDAITAISGGVVLLILVTDPNGLFDTWARLGNRLRRAGVTRRAAQPVTPEQADRLPSGLELGGRLAVRDLTVEFGPTRVLDGVSFDIAPGQVVGIIGPNGAGKTTLVDAICGTVRASGSTRLGDVELTGLSVRRRARAGVGRTFQTVELFDDMTVLDNIRTAAESRGARSYVVDVLRPRASRLPPVAVAAIRDLELWHDLDRGPDELPSGRRRLVAIARALAAEPRVLLLDEPAAGLSDDEKVELGRLVRELAERWKLPVVLIEHDVQMVAGTCDHVVALSLGSVLAEGPPAEVLRHPEVVSAYLGAEHQSTDSPLLAEGAPR